MKNGTAVWPLLVALVLSATYFLPIHSINLVSNEAAWSTQGCFKADSVYPSTQFGKEISHLDRRDLRLWGSWCESDKSTGALYSPIFEAPRILELLIAGYAGNPGLAMFLEREDDHSRFPLPVGRQPRERWEKFQWWIPAHTQGHNVRLVALDNATASWLGVSSPRTISLAGLLEQQLRSSLLPILIFLAQLALFLWPGFVLASWLAAQRTIPTIYLVIIVIVTGAALGYLAFWAFFFLKLLGKIFCYGAYALSATMLFSSVRSKFALKATAKQVAEPLLYTTLAGLCYLCFFFLFVDPAQASIYASERFFVEIFPGDNVIPHILAEKIYSREPVRPFCCGDWLSSDRPPLEAGIVLLERLFPLTKNIDLRYELLTSAIQCFWICGVWCLLKALDTPVRRIRQVLGFLIFSGFLFFNSVYTWPKLLAAAMLLFVMAILLQVLRTRQVMTNLEALIAATCLGLALMSHPGCAFSLAGVVILPLWFRRLFPLKRFALAAAVVLAFYLPWSAYQKYVDPPGNRLLKIHLAGVLAIDSRSIWATLRDSYREHTMGEIIRYKWSNVAFLGGRKLFDSYGLSALRLQGGLHVDAAATEISRIAQREFIWNAVGIANLGWLAIPVVLLGARRKQFAMPFSGWLIGLAIVNFIFWSFITFGPNETITAHSSYMDIILVSVGLLGFVLALPRFVYVSVLVLQLFNFFVVWVWSLPARIAPPVLIQVPLLALGIGVMAVLLWLSFGRNVAQPPIT